MFLVSPVVAWKLPLLDWLGATRWCVPLSAVLVRRARIEARTPLGWLRGFLSHVLAPPSGLLAPLAALNLRFVKCLTPSDDGLLASCEAYLILAEMPRAFPFPGHEILARLADLGFGIDYALRTTVKTHEEARAADRRRTRDLMGQDEEHGADSAGVPADVHSAQEEIQHKNARLAASSTEVDLNVGVIASAARCRVRRAARGGSRRAEAPDDGGHQSSRRIAPAGGRLREGPRGSVRSTL
ncbi:hypothetical protein F9C11_24220 [Amycolatopsis sp. VS8301801F10]|uniref:hypothetical protein n=1 Tax=Amycolatopsis sp. VS8301801F10 TaxID=2652442 RepID=UPI0038FC728F